MDMILNKLSAKQHEFQNEDNIVCECTKTNIRAIYFPVHATAWLDYLGWI